MVCLLKVVNYHQWNLVLGLGPISSPPVGTDAQFDKYLDAVCRSLLYPNLLSILLNFIPCLRSQASGETNHLQLSIFSTASGEVSTTVYLTFLGQLLRVRDPARAKHLIFFLNSVTKFLLLGTSKTTQKI